MAFAVEGFRAIAQNYISRGVASNFYAKTPFLTALGAVSLGHRKTDPLTIGRPYDDNLSPTKGEILTGTNINKATLLTDIVGRNAYLPRIQTAESDNSSFAGSYTPYPTVANASTSAHSVLTQASAEFRWCTLRTPILIRNYDLVRAGNAETQNGANIGAAKLIEEATEIAYQEHITKLNYYCWNGNPTDQDADPWNQPLGIVQAVDTANVYGRVDRSKSANSVWRANKETGARSADIGRLLDEANLDWGIGTKGNGVNLVLCNTAQYKLFKSQVLSQGGSILQNGIPEMGAYGVKREVLQKDNAYVMYDPLCTAGYVYMLDLAMVKFIVHPQFNFKVWDFKDISKLAQGAADATTSYIETMFMLSFDNPFLSGVFTNVS